jgi:hypothetical protein
LLQRLAPGLKQGRIAGAIGQLQAQVEPPHRHHRLGRQTCLRKSPLRHASEGRGQRTLAELLQPGDLQSVLRPIGGPLQVGVEAGDAQRDGHGSTLRLAP